MVNPNPDHTLLETRDDSIIYFAQLESVLVPEAGEQSPETSASVEVSEVARIKRRKISPERAVASAGSISVSDGIVTLVERRIDIDLTAISDKFGQSTRGIGLVSGVLQAPVDVTVVSNPTHLKLELWSTSTSTQLADLRFHPGDYSNILFELEWVSRIVTSQKLPPKHPKRVDDFKADVNLRIQDVTDGVALLLQLEVSVTMAPCNGWSRKSLALTEQWYQLIAYAFPQGKPQVENVAPVTARDFYESVTIPPREGVPTSIQPHDLECELLPFQRRAVRWMLRKEGYDIQGQSSELREYQPHPDEFSPPLFFKGIDRRGQVCWVSHILGVVVLATRTRALIDAHCEYRGGILAEEMGLGKTVELIALIMLNRRPQFFLPSRNDSYTKKNIVSSSATLIITPPSILRQWQAELNTHAPSLKVFHYQGVKKQKVDVSVDDLVQYDVVLTTYDVLSAEIYFAQASTDRTLREAKKYIPKSSPLVRIFWWRVCLDEAQMVETGVSNAAIVARTIPRVNAWAVTGTPVRKDIQDLLGLLIFLRYEPFSGNIKAWKYLTLYNKQAFSSLFGNLTLRHVKEAIRDELELPPQSRVIITVPFSHIEEQNYSFLFDTMCNECNVSSEKLVESGMQVDSVTLEKLKRWLVRLRQSCTHPEVGSGNRKALGGGSGPLRSVSEVLDIMIEQHDAQLRTSEKTLFSLMLKRAQMLEYYEKSEQAMEIYKSVLEQAQRVIAECRQHIQKEQVQDPLQLNRVIKEQQEVRQSSRDIEARGEINASDQGGAKVTADNDRVKLGPWRLRLRTFLEVEHAALFFIGSIFYQMKIVEERKGSSGEREKYNEYEKLEAENYEAAKVIRKELLAETGNRAQRLINMLKYRAGRQEFSEVPELKPSKATGGIEIRTILDGLNQLKEALNEQANVLDEWREMVVQALTHPLIDEGEIASGAEFEESINYQELGIVYLEAVKAMVTDRDVALTGQQNILIEDDLKRALGRKEVHTALLQKLVAQRELLKPQKVARPMRELLSALRGLVNALKDQEHNGNSRAAIERKLAEAELKELQETFPAQLKANVELGREIDLYRDTINARVDFYRQLQTISDTVVPYDSGKEQSHPNFSEAVLQKMLKKEEGVESEIARGRAKGKYLAHLKVTSTGEVRHCIICQCNFETGSLTVCGHQYCKECLLEWFRSHRSCPLCKKALKAEDIYPITYKPKDVSFQEEEPTNPVLPLYDKISNAMLKEIKLIDLAVSFGSKIDMICRHLIWIRRSEPFAKCVVFSQWSDVLAVLERAFTENNINFVSMAKDGVSLFKNDPKIQCFLLHAKSQSAGLTLVNAAHVFICEPLLNPGIELQAISRVHRIGQSKPTTVWLYVVSHTVEESVLRLATKRRLALMGGKNDIEETSLGGTTPVEITEAKLNIANSLELRLNQGSLVEKTPGGGEIVKNEDLWECLVVSAKERLERSKLEKEVKRHLFAEAAERRVRKKQMETDIEEANSRDLGSGRRGNVTTIEIRPSNLKEGQPGPSNYTDRL